MTGQPDHTDTGTDHVVIPRRTNTIHLELRAANGSHSRIRISWVAQNVVCCRWASGKMQGGWPADRLPHVFDRSGLGDWSVVPVQCGNCGTTKLPKGLKIVAE